MSSKQSKKLRRAINKEKIKIVNSHYGFVMFQLEKKVNKFKNIIYALVGVIGVLIAYITVI